MSGAHTPPPSRLRKPLLLCFLGTLRDSTPHPRRGGFFLLLHPLGGQSAGFPDPRSLSPPAPLLWLLTHRLVSTESRGSPEPALHVERTEDPRTDPGPGAQRETLGGGRRVWPRGELPGEGRSQHPGPGAVLGTQGYKCLVLGFLPKGLRSEQALTLTPTAVGQALPSQLPAFALTSELPPTPRPAQVVTTAPPSTCQTRGGFT